MARLARSAAGKGCQAKAILYKRGGTVASERSCTKLSTPWLRAAGAAAHQDVNYSGAHELPIFRLEVRRPKFGTSSISASTLAYRRKRSRLARNASSGKRSFAASWQAFIRTSCGSPRLSAGQVPAYQRHPRGKRSRRHNACVERTAGGQTGSLPSHPPSSAT